MTRPTFADMLFCGGILAIVRGAGALHPAAAWIVAGVALGAVGVRIARGPGR